MTQCRDLENRHHEKLLEISITTLEKSAKNELDEDLPADVRMVRAPRNSSLLGSCQEEEATASSQQGRGFQEAQYSSSHA